MATSRIACALRLGLLGAIATVGASAATVSGGRGGDVGRIPQAPHAVVDPAAVGPDLPPRGRSAFDRVFARAPPHPAGHAIPYPFSRLLERLEQEIGAAPGSRDGLAIVLIPLGRSLQREAGAPDFFRFPRVVVAVDGQPRTVPRRLLLADRLFLGYHEKARVLEVISYNEEAGRFEFQVVDDYGPGGTPRVRYARRALCLACHQNAAPMFSRAGWDETNANARVARRLRAARADFYGIPPALDGAAAARVDNATDRANLFAAWQLLWRAGCGDEASAAPGCRAALLVAALQHALGASNGHDRDAAAFRERFVAISTRAWAGRWPHGLAIPDGDLVNRDPLAVPGVVAAGVDPLAPRGPAMIWHAAGDGERVVAGLAQSIAEADLRRLDEFLLRRARRSGARRARIDIPCRVALRGSGSDRHRIEAHCGDPTAAGAGALDLDVAVRGGRVHDGQLRSLTLASGARFERVRLRAAVIGKDADGTSVLRAEAAQRESERSVRDLSGDALDRLELRWHPAQGQGSGPRAGTAVLWKITDFAPVREAADALAARAGDGGALADGLLRPVALMQSLFDALGLPPSRWCCDVEPPPVAVAAAAVERSVDPGPPGGGVIARFVRLCGACHAAATRSPPGFLHGGERAAAAGVRHCSARIARRLALWDEPAAARTRSPMPPPSILAARGLDEASWRSGEDLAALRAHVATLLAGSTRGLSRSREGRDDDLPPCLPGAKRDGPSTAR